MTTIFCKYISLKELLILFCLSTTCNITFSESIDTYIMKKQGCKAGSEAAAPIAKAAQDIIMDVVNTTQPNSAERKRKYQEAIDMTDKVLDKVYEQIKNKKSELSKESRKNNTDVDKVLIEEMNNDLYYTFFFFGYQSGISMAIINASKNNLYSEIKYERVIYEECIAITPARK